jgi:hypothetical protein
MTLEDLVSSDVITCLEHENYKQKKGMKARNELNERNLNELITTDKSTTKDFD